MHPRHLHARDEVAHAGHLLRLLVAVNERYEVHLGPAAHLPELVVRAEAIAAVGCIRQPMREVEDPHHTLWPAGEALRCLMTRAGTPAATTPGGTGRVTTAPAPMTEFSPMSAMTTAALP